VDQAIRFEIEISQCTVILYFDCSDEQMIKRLLGRGLTSGRVDDNEETIKMRLNTFHLHTQPILNHFGKKVVKINAERHPDEIFVEVSECLNSLILHDKSHLM